MVSIDFVVKNLCTKYCCKSLNKQSSGVQERINPFYINSYGENSFGLRATIRNELSSWTEVWLNLKQPYQRVGNSKPQLQKEARSILWVRSRYAHGPLMVRSRYAHAPLMIRIRSAQSAHGTHTGRSWYAKGPPMVRSRFAHDTFTFRSRYAQGPLMVYSWSAHGTHMVRSWYAHNPRTVRSWYAHGSLTVT